MAGLLNGIGMTSLNECLALEEAASQAVTRTTAIGGIGYIDESAVIASRASTFISSVAENIGVENEIYFPVLLKVSASGTINNIWGYQAGCTFPLSDYFPGSAAQLYQNGNCHAAAIVANAGSIANEINAVTMILYYRVDARNYANRYTSNATTCYGGSRYPMDPTYYNPNYTFHVGKDCANFVSQAIHYGGIPKTATWTPGASAWSVVGSLVDYFASTSPMIYEANFDTCVAGGFIATVGSGGSREHVVMCVQNDTVTHCYSAHTQDVLKAVYTSSYPGKEGKSAKYYNFVYTTTETQYADGRLD